MKRTYRLRRVTAAAVLGMGMTAGVIGVTAGVAGAAGSASTWTAPSPKKVPTTTAAGAAVSTMVLKAAANATLTATETFTVTLPTGAKFVTGDGTVALGGTHATSPTATWTANTTNAATLTLNYVAGTGAKIHATETFTISGAKIKTSSLAAGTKIDATITTTATHTGIAQPTTNAAEIAYTATASTGNKIAAASKTKVTATGSNLKAGNLTLTLTNGTGAKLTTSKLTLTIKPGTTTTTTATWYKAPTVTGSGLVATVTAPSKKTLTLKITETAGKTGTVTLTTVRYTTAAAKGTINVTPTWKTSASTTVVGTFTPTSVANAYATTTTPPTSASPTIKAVSTPFLKGTGSGQAAGNWTLSFATVTKGHGWHATEQIKIAVNKKTGVTTYNCTAAKHGYVLFTGAPTPTLTSSTNVSTAPTFKVTTDATGTHCTGVNRNQAVLTFTNSGTFTSTTVAKNKAVITLSNVKYATKAGTTPIYGKVSVTLTGGTASATGVSNADIVSVFVSANTPAVTLMPGAYNGAISPVKLVENTAGSVSSGYVCVSLSGKGTSHFNAATTATAKATGGNGAVTSKVIYETSTGTKKTSGTATYAVFDVKTASSTAKPTTYEVSGLGVNASSTPGAVKVTLQPATTSTNCAAKGTAYGTATTAFTIATTSKRVYGATAAATAVKLLQQKYAGTGTGTCVGGTATTAHTTKRIVVIATETHFQDALSSQYLASYLKTGDLLTAYGSLPSVTMQALRTEGVTHVDIVGGTLAVSKTVANEIASLPAYNCGGTSVLTTTSGAVRDITVSRIAGYTAEGTARQINGQVSSGHILSKGFVGAYATVNATKGMGAYNDTPAQGTVPTTGSAVPTAIMASATEFQDAMAASTLSYWQTTGKSMPIILTSPTSLTATATAALVTDGIKQVILMGGTMAVTNGVVKSLSANGIEVLRVAGKTYNDTATQLAKFEMGTAGVTGLGWTSTQVSVARGTGFTDGLVGAVVAGQTPEPLLLTTSPTAVGSYLTAFLKAYGATGPTATHGKIKTLQIFGGTLAVTPAVVAQMQSDIG